MDPTEATNEEEAIPKCAEERQVRMRQRAEVMALMRVEQQFRPALATLLRAEDRFRQEVLEDAQRQRQEAEVEP